MVLSEERVFVSKIVNPFSSILVIIIIKKEEKRTKKMNEPEYIVRPHVACISQT